MEGVDAWDYVVIQWVTALVQMILGDDDAAISSLEAVMRESFFFTNPGTLELDPLWDPLRHNPRFQALLEMELPGR